MAISTAILQWTSHFIAPANLAPFLQSYPALSNLPDNSTLNAAWVDRVYIEAPISRCLNAPPLCTDADDLLCCSAAVGNLAGRGVPDILT